MSINSQKQGRVALPDLLRAAALMGIIVVNAVGFSWPLEEGYKTGAIQSSLDAAAEIAMAGLFMFKAYPLFSMMFGAGLAFQIAAAERANAAFGPRYFRRLGALFILGVLHFTLFWIGDILMVYALLGALLYAVKDLPIKRLIMLGVTLIIINTAILAALAALIWVGETFAPEEMPTPEDIAEMTAATRLAFGEGTFWQAALHRLSLLSGALIGGLIQQGLGVFGFFCFGLAAVKAGAITDPTHTIWTRSRRLYLPIGLVLSFLGANFYHRSESVLSSEMFLGLAIMMAASPFSAMGYAGLIAKASIGTLGPIRRFFAKAGSASLTAYLLQSLILSLVFTAYGFGQFATLNAALITIIAVIAGLASLIFTGIWRSFASRGPMEALLRRFTYWESSR